MQRKGSIEMSVQKNAKKRLWKQIWRHRTLYLFMLPCVVWLVVFCYVPMAGNVLAFKNYRFDKGIFGSEWAGLKHFEAFVTAPEFWMTIRNTLVISGLKILICFPAPIILALLLNEVRAPKFKRLIQTMSYLPNFVSWAVVVSLMTAIFTPYGGIYNNIRKALGMESVFLMGEKTHFTH